MKKCIFPPTAKRVAYHTASQVNQEIRAQTVDGLNAIQGCGEPAFTARIRKLEEEWNTERFLEAHAASIVLMASIGGYQKKNCACFALTGCAGFFLLMHALMGWCPPLPVIRRFGIRTPEEISNEKFAVKMLRGDFSAQPANMDEMLQLMEKD
ncbi:hypothetical protein CAFE_06530 [Caprobacter fermentans]|uniref:DUF2892 domain-containing protein n=1 Tax=Caproicibacter fermentans TaxID=2576756 RepID=A0A6N8HW78_9FIRM|nr:DUF2892 domain-containing protein [Caproicibacter fermentans]MVB09982.1 hypothetical protein [Caproicibacter fermentans]OCN00237.1 hypothetical protein A7X67_09205 [Clostridium sp. W14A]QNK42072.1 DUF2892 domain-containing protein [Caproicibacter fermentans]